MRNPQHRSRGRVLVVWTRGLQRLRQTCRSQRIVCSDNCAEALAREAKAMDLILQKSLQNARASAFYSFLCGGLSAAGAVGAYFYLQVPFLIWFCAGCAVVFTASGLWFAAIARKSRD